MAQRENVGHSSNVTVQCKIVVRIPACPEGEFCEFLSSTAMMANRSNAKLSSAGRVPASFTVLTDSVRRQVTM